jgi:hypothetical protein
MRIDPSSLISAQVARAQTRPEAVASKHEFELQFEPINLRKATEDARGARTTSEVPSERAGARLDIKV